MELVDGGSLQSLLESVGNLPEMPIKSIATQLLEALYDVHIKLNNIHGAISPSQILFDRSGNIKVYPLEICSISLVVSWLMSKN